MNKTGTPVPFYWTEEVTRQGAPLIIRSTHKGDRLAMQNILRQLSPTSLYMRFLAPKRQLSDRDLDYLTNIDQAKHVALIAELIGPQDHFPVGVARYICDADDPSVAELAISVVENYQRRGIGTLLLRHLLLLAKRNGITKVYGLALSENVRLISMVEHLELPTKFELADDGLVKISIALVNASAGRITCQASK
jgi:GNAT superfamily N-acetyltransferase